MQRIHQTGFAEKQNPEIGNDRNQKPESVYVIDEEGNIIMPPNLFEEDCSIGVVEQAKVSYQ